MRLSSEDNQIPDPRDIHSNPHADHPGLLGGEDLLRTSPFPLHGLIGHPGGLTLRGTGYSTAFGQFETPYGRWQADRPVLWQVSLVFDYPPAHRLTGHTLELSTIDIQRAPMQASVLDADEMAHRPRYLVPEDVPLGTTEGASFVVERFPIVDGVVLAAMEYEPNSRLHFTATHAVRLSEWIFTLWDPPLWVEGRATEWTQIDLFSVLGTLALVSQRPDILRQYQRELQAWDQYIQSTRLQRPL